MKAVREAMSVMTSMKEVYDAVLNYRRASQLPDNEQAQLVNLKKTILQAIELGDTAWAGMVGGGMTSEESSVVLSFVRVKNEILEDLA